MTSKLVRLLIVVGLPGAGKSRLIDTKLRQTVTGLCVHDFHGNAFDDSSEVTKSRHFMAISEALRAGHDCIVADIEFCRRDRREIVVQTFKAWVLGLKIEYHCLKNQLERCQKNIENRNRSSAQEEKRKAEELSIVYEIPDEAIEYDVWQKE